VLVELMQLPEPLAVLPPARNNPGTAIPTPPASAEREISSVILGARRLMRVSFSLEFPFRVYFWSGLK